MKRFISSTIGAAGSASLVAFARITAPKEGTSSIQNKSSTVSPPTAAVVQQHVLMRSVVGGSMPACCACVSEQRRAQSSHISPSAIANVKKGTPAITFTPYKVFHVVCKHDPKLRGRQGPHLMAIAYNRFQRLTGSELAAYKRSATKLNRLRTLASQRLLLSSMVLRRFGVENYRRIYPNSSVTVGGASRAARKMLELTHPKKKMQRIKGNKKTEEAKKKTQLMKKKSKKPVNKKKVTDGNKKKIAFKKRSSSSRSLVKKSSSSSSTSSAP